MLELFQGSLAHTPRPIQLLILRRWRKILIHLGFVAVRQKGSHFFYRYPNGRTTTLPNHPGQDLARPLIRENLREIEITPEEYKDLVDNLKFFHSTPLPIYFKQLKVKRPEVGRFTNPQAPRPGLGCSSCRRTWNLAV